MSLKAVKLLSLSTLSHYFQDEMGGYTKQAVVLGFLSSIVRCGCGRFHSCSFMH